MDLTGIKFPPLLFITGIGTDVGKSYATGALAREMAASGLNVITQKFVQTGCRETSEDIECHRRLMGIPMQTADLTHLTAPLIFSYPASPHLAAKIDGREVDLDVVEEASRTLLRQYSHVLLEGAGGLMVPLKGDYLTIDYIRDHNLPVVLVTNGKLGSISDTLLNLSVIKSSGIKLFALVYNTYFDKDKTIADDARNYIADWIKSKFPETLFFTL